MKSDVQLNLELKSLREHSSMLLQRSFINREPTLSGDGLQGCGECDP